MGRLPEEITRLLTRGLYVKGTRVPVYRVLELLAAPDGDIIKIRKALCSVADQDLRETFTACAQLLKVLQQIEAAPPDITPRRKRAKVSPADEVVPNAKELLDKTDRLKVFVDGSSRGNPGPGACAYVFKDLKDNVLMIEGMFLPSTTANAAEAMAIIKALKHAIHLSKKKIHLFSDSELIINQITGVYRIRNEYLVKLHKEIQSLLHKMEFFQAVKIERALNREADSLTRYILEQAMEQQS